MSRGYQKVKELLPMIEEMIKKGISQREIEAVALALDVDDSGVMKHAVKYG